MTAAVAAEAPSPGRVSSGFTQAAILIIVGIVATTLAQPLVLSSLPIRNMLKNELHVSRSDLSAFVFLSGLPWYAKPLAGVITDAFPLFGQRRRSYLVASSLLAAAGWAGIYYTPHQYGRLLWMAILVNCFMVFASTVIGGYLVETAQASGSSGRLTSVREATQRVCIIITGPASGYLATVNFAWTAAASGMVVFLLVPATILLLHEPRARVESRQVLGVVGRQLKNVGGSKALWAAAALSMLVYIAPGFSTAVFYKQQNEFHMLPNAGPGLPGFFGGQGFLGVIAGLSGLAAAGLYAWACRRFDLRALLAACIGLSALLTVGYLHYASATDARIMAGVDSFGVILAELSLMDLAVRATPRGSEGLGYALMISVRNVSIFGTDFLGSLMLDKWRLSFQALVVANAVTTAVAVPLVLLLPRALVRRKDADLYESAPEPDTQVQD